MPAQRSQVIRADEMFFLGLRWLSLFFRYNFSLEQLEKICYNGENLLKSAMKIHLDRSL